MDRYDLSDPEQRARCNEWLHDARLDLDDGLPAARGVVVLPGWSTGGNAEHGLTIAVRGVTDVELVDGAGIEQTFVDHLRHEDGWLVVEGHLPVDLRFRTDDPVVELAWTAEVRSRPRFFRR